jgi:hypothetical protein
VHAHITLVVLVAHQLAGGAIARWRHVHRRSSGACRVRAGRFSCLHACVFCPVQHHALPRAHLMRIFPPRPLRMLPFVVPSVLLLNAGRQQRDKFPGRREGGGRDTTILGLSVHGRTNGQPVGGRAESGR